MKGKSVKMFWWLGLPASYYFLEIPGNGRARSPLRCVPTLSDGVMVSSTIFVLNENQYIAIKD